MLAEHEYYLFPLLAHRCTREGRDDGIADADVDEYCVIVILVNNSCNHPSLFAPYTKRTHKHTHTHILRFVKKAFKIINSISNPGNWERFPNSTVTDKRFPLAQPSMINKREWRNKWTLWFRLAGFGPKKQGQAFERFSFWSTSLQYRFRNRMKDLCCCLPSSVSCWSSFLHIFKSCLKILAY